MPQEIWDEYSGREEDIPIFWQPKLVTPLVNDNDQSFFCLNRMGEDTFSKIVKRGIYKI